MTGMNRDIIDSFETTVVKRQRMDLGGIIFCVELHPFFLEPSSVSCQMTTSIKSSVLYMSELKEFRNEEANFYYF